MNSVPVRLSVAIETFRCAAFVLYTSFMPYDPILHTSIRFPAMLKQIDAVGRVHLHSMPVPGERSVPWWDAELLELREILGGDEYYAEDFEGVEY